MRNAVGISSAEMEKDVRRREGGLAQLVGRMTSVLWG